jgi:osmotically-inducible protein OsmY
MCTGEPTPRRGARTIALSRRFDMNMLKRVFAILAAALMLAALGCAGTEKRQSTGAYLDDTAITTKVKTAIFNEPTLKVNDIKVDTNASVVLLRGVVPSQADMMKAGDIARAVPGVAAVRNDLQIK